MTINQIIYTARFHSCERIHFSYSYVYEAAAAAAGLMCSLCVFDIYVLNAIHYSAFLSLCFDIRASLLRNSHSYYRHGRAREYLSARADIAWQRSGRVYLRHQPDLSPTNHAARLVEPHEYSRARPSP